MPLAMTDETLGYHLLYNLFPPVTRKMIPYAKQAIMLYRDGRSEHDIVLRNGERTMTKTAREIVNDLRLEEYVD